MSITFFCDCGQRLEVQEAFIGTQRRCRACRKWLTVPAAGTFVSTLVPDKPKEQEEADPRYRASWIDVAWILPGNAAATAFASLGVYLYLRVGWNWWLVLTFLLFLASFGTGGSRRETNAKKRGVPMACDQLLGGSLLAMLSAAAAGGLWWGGHPIWSCVLALGTPLGIVLCFKPVRESDVRDMEEAEQKAEHKLRQQAAQKRERAHQERPSAKQARLAADEAAGIFRCQCGQIKERINLGNSGLGTSERYIHFCKHCDGTYCPRCGRRQPTTYCRDDWHDTTYLACAVCYGNLEEEKAEQT